ncbi:zona pellucida sperm-binding protein 3-like isoform X2 [Boleophthalmus pectinirostris]|uniref:zona pellucida sperm-binding protein 3-like isoform X2 n=1 Tax=Boleophthalmus pectinirostris TaxID=150288 RepID=UPI00242DF4CE|nr:zona pellucida sperm-binding protein 3-like isoform X2 [Boleophthalmus pectinirostris]
MRKRRPSRHHGNWSKNLWKNSRNQSEDFEDFVQSKSVKFVALDGAGKEETDFEFNIFEADKLEFPKLQVQKAVYKVMLKSEQREPVPADSVEVNCGEDEITIDVKQNFLGNGQQILPPDLTLGHCPLVAVTDDVLHFKSSLQSCGSTMTLSDEALVYSFSLLYKPSPIGNTFILKTSPAEVLVECRYPRKQIVNSEDMSPTWFPVAAYQLSDQQIQFSMRLMTEDWSSPRPSSVYTVNDVMNMEVSVLRGRHIPVRVFVEQCAATAKTSPGSEPRYEFVNNYGCFMDSKLTGAKSFFLQRIEEEKLHFILQTFRFRQQLGNSMYITCKLKATSVSVPIDSEHKACSFLNEANRWVASEGDNNVCSCCESSCGGKRKRRSHREESSLQWEETAVLGPIIFKTRDDDFSDLKSDVTEAPPSVSLVVLCGAGVVLSVILLLLLVAITVNKMHKSHLYHVYV